MPVRHAGFPACVSVNSDKIQRRASRQEEKNLMLSPRIFSPLPKESAKAITANMPGFRWRPARDAMGYRDLACL